MTQTTDPTSFKNQKWFPFIAMISMFGWAAVGFFGWFTHCQTNEPVGQYSEFPTVPQLIVQAEIDTVTPRFVPNVGGVSLLIKGKYFSTQTTVAFDDVPSSHVQFVSANELLVLLPPLPGRYGDVDIRIVADSLSENAGIVVKHKLSCYSAQLQLAAPLPLADINDPLGMVIVPSGADGRSRLLVYTYKDVYMTTWDPRIQRLTSQPLPISPGSEMFSGLVQADWNGDTHPDVALSTSEGRILLLINDGQGNFSTPIETSTGQKNILPLSVVDVNQDHRLDLLVGLNSSLGVLLGKDYGKFQLTRFTFAGFAVLRAEGMDLTQDGLVDGLVHFRNNLILFGGNPGGTFQAPYPIALDMQVSGFHIQDVDDDQKAEILVAGLEKTSGHPQFTVWTPKSERWSLSQSYPLPGAIRTLTLQDINGDSLPDALISGAQNELYVLLGFGDGTFDGASTHAGVPFMQALVTGDVDGDHRPDVMALAKYSNKNTIHLLLNVSP